MDSEVFPDWLNTNFIGLAILIISFKLTGELSQRTNSYSLIYLAQIVLFSACNFIKKETLAQVFSCEFCEISKNTFFYRTPLVAACILFIALIDQCLSICFGFNWSIKDISSRGLVIKFPYSINTQGKTDWLKYHSVFTCSINLANHIFSFLTKANHIFSFLTNFHLIYSLLETKLTKIFRERLIK